MCNMWEVGYRQGYAKGYRQGYAEGYKRGIISSGMSLGLSEEEIISAFVELCEISNEQAEEFYSEYATRFSD